jgi:hypothetical protein
MTWEPWQFTEQRTLARYATPEAVRLLSLPIHEPNLRDLYRDRDGKREVVRLIYNAMCLCQINYASDPSNSEAGSQIIRQPRAILDPPHEATCLDLALLFGGIYLYYDLLPLIVLTKGHAFLAVSCIQCQSDLRQPARRDEIRFFDRGLLPKEQTQILRDLIDRGIYLALECTGCAYTNVPGDTPERKGRNRKGRTSGRMPFARAVDAGREQLDVPERPFEYALDLHELHLHGFPAYPLDPVSSPTPVVCPEAVRPEKGQQLPGGADRALAGIDSAALERHISAAKEAIEKANDLFNNSHIRPKDCREASQQLADTVEHVGELFEQVRTIDPLPAAFHDVPNDLAVAYFDIQCNVGVANLKRRIDTYRDKCSRTDLKIEEEREIEEERKGIQAKIAEIRRKVYDACDKIPMPDTDGSAALTQRDEIHRGGLERSREIRREGLEKRLAELNEEHKAANSQHASTLSEVDRVRLRRQIQHIEEQMRSVEQELKGP